VYTVYTLVNTVITRRSGERRQITITAEFVQFLDALAAVGARLHCTLTGVICK